MKGFFYELILIGFFSLCTWFIRKILNNNQPKPIRLPAIIALAVVAVTAGLICLATASIDASYSGYLAALLFGGMFVTWSGYPKRKDRQ